MSGTHALWSPAPSENAPLAVLLHGRGADEHSGAALAAHIPDTYQTVALRGPVSLGAGRYTWFENQGIGRPQPASLAHSIAWFRDWQTREAADRQIVVVGFSGGAAFAGAVVLEDPTSVAGAALLYGTGPFDAGLSTEPGRLEGARVFHAQSADDEVMPKDLMDRTWHYLRLESGANVVAMRTSGPHDVSHEVSEGLQRWLTVVEPRLGEV